MAWKRDTARNERLNSVNPYISANVSNIDNRLHQNTSIYSGEQIPHSMVNSSQFLPQNVDYMSHSATGKPDLSVVKENRVYVGNLSFHTQVSELREYMQQAGDIIACDILLNYDGKSKGCALVEFSTKEQALNAVRMFHDSTLSGRPILVREDREEKNSKSVILSVVKDNRVYVGNLSFQVQNSDLKEHMLKAGEVISCSILTSYDGKSKGCALVEFVTRDQALEAVRTLNDSNLMGRPILVREDREEKNSKVLMSKLGKTSLDQRLTAGVATTQIVFVGNLSWSVTEDDLKELMGRAGTVLSCDLKKDLDGKSKGCALVEFSSSQEAQVAIETLHDIDLKGRIIFVREDRPLAPLREPPVTINRELYRLDESHARFSRRPGNHMDSRDRYTEERYASKREYNTALVQPVSFSRPQIYNQISVAPAQFEAFGTAQYNPYFASQGAMAMTMGQQQQYATMQDYHNAALNVQYGLTHTTASYGHTCVASSVPVTVPYQEYRPPQKSYVDTSNCLSCHVYVGNLSYDVNWQELKDHMRVVGEVLHAEILGVSESGRSKGCGIVEYMDPGSAKYAIANLNNTMLKGRPIFVREDRVRNNRR